LHIFATAREDRVIINEFDIWQMMREAGFVPGPSWQDVRGGRA